MPDRVKVLYIAGTARCGSTIFGNVLGQMAGFTHVGELWHLWTDGILSNLACGCGAKFHDCEFWRAVQVAAFGKPEAAQAEQMARLLRSSTRTRHLPMLTTSYGRRLLRNTLDPLLAQTEKLYRGLEEATDGRIIIDSSKNPAYGFLLSLIPSLEVAIVHLVRDPRGVAFSSAHRKFRPDTQGYLEPTSVGRTAMFWTTWNIVILRSARKKEHPYVRIRYEDFVKQPAVAAKQVAAVFGQENPDLSFITSHGVYLRGQHAVAGNPSRFEHGSVSLRLDCQWEEQMSAIDRWAVTFLTLPLLGKFGYPVRTGPKPGEAAKRA